MFQKLSPNCASMIRWVLKAASKDDARPILQCVNIQDQIITATDGFRIHRWNFRGAERDVHVMQDKSSIGLLTDLDNGIYSLAQYGIILEYDKWNAGTASYPDIKKIGVKEIIVTSHGTAQVAFNPKFMIDAISAPTENYFGKVLFEIGQLNFVLYPEGSLKVGGMAHAIVMPMFTEYPDHQPTAVRETRFNNPDIDEWRKELIKKKENPS